MHISEGVLSIEVATIGWALTTPALIYGVKNLRDEQIIKVSIITALFFVISLIHIPIGASNIHLMLIGVIGVILGFYSFIAITLALLIQALLLGYGGLTSLGANSFNISMGAISGYFIFKYFKDKINSTILYFLIGSISTLVTLILLSITLFFSSENFLTALKVLFIANIPLIIIEGVVTIFIFNFLRKFKIEIFNAI